MGMTGAMMQSQCIWKYISTISGADCMQLDLTGYDIECVSDLPEQVAITNGQASSLRTILPAVHSIRVLYLPHCGLTSLDGFNCMPALEELYAAFNLVSCLEPLMDAEHLQVLDLEGNAISELEQLDFLGACERLETVCITSNPVCNIPDLARHAALQSLNVDCGLDCRPCTGSCDSNSITERGPPEFHTKGAQCKSMPCPERAGDAHECDLITAALRHKSASTLPVAASTICRWQSTKRSSPAKPYSAGPSMQRPNPGRSPSTCALKPADLQARPSAHEETLRFVDLRQLPPDDLSLLPLPWTRKERLNGLNWAMEASLLIQGSPVAALRRLEHREGSLARELLCIRQLLTTTANITTCWQQACDSDYLVDALGAWGEVEFSS
eukprot:jgi/Ulvmu1/10216/UM060_0016.1